MFVWKRDAPALTCQVSQVFKQAYMLPWLQARPPSIKQTLKSRLPDRQTANVRCRKINFWSLVFWFDINAHQVKSFYSFVLTSCTRVPTSINLMLCLFICRSKVISTTSSDFDVKNYSIISVGSWLKETSYQLVSYLKDSGFYSPRWQLIISFQRV